MSHYAEQFEEHQQQEQERRRAVLKQEATTFLETSDNARLLEIVRVMREFDRIRALLSFLRW